jgi:5-methylthioadenosine/S-adenosylhomocysteine deaminase
MILKNCRFVIADSKKLLENVDIEIDEKEGKIISVVNFLEKSSIKKTHKGKVIDCSNKIVMPSFANTHTHAAMSLFRGYGEEMELMQWLEKKMWPVEAKLKEPDVYAGSLISCIEMIKSGTTAFNDMYFFMDAVAQAVKDTGMRASLSWAVVNKEISSQKGAPLDNAEKFIRKWKNDPMIKPSVGPHAIYTCSDETLKKSKSLAEKYGTLMHIHVSETRKEVYDCWTKNGRRPVEHLDHLKLLDENTVAAHCGWLTKNEIAVLEKKNVSISHCPASNMKLATGGEFPFSELFGKANVTIGTDSCASNNNLNMFEEMKFASLAHKHNRWSSTVATAQQVFQAATENGFKALGIKSGKLEAGYNADLLLLDANDVSLQPATKDRILNHIVYANPVAAVDSVMCNGKFLMKDRKLTVISEEKARKLFEKSVERLF